MMSTLSSIGKIGMAQGRGLIIGVHDDKSVARPFAAAAAIPNSHRQIAVSEAGAVFVGQPADLPCVARPHERKIGIINSELGANVGWISMTEPDF